jgi:hypothetical protein
MHKYTDSNNKNEKGVKDIKGRNEKGVKDMEDEKIEITVPSGSRTTSFFKAFAIK